jgi:CxxC motif-containing protein (DUF1111 family)
MATSCLALAAAAGCAAGEEVATSDVQQSATTLGAALPGTDMTKFAEAKANFAAEEEIEDGLGPTFNEKACGNCHGIPVLGGSGAQIERRFGRITDGVFYGFDQPADNEGGTLRQLFANAPYTNGTTSCTIAVDQEAPTANVHNVGRRSLPLFGLGLVDAMPDFWFDLLAALEPAATRGRVVRSIPNFPDPRDPAQGLTLKRVARFGIKDQQTNLLSFSGDGYVNEMGITTQSCYKGTSILAFAFENYPNGNEPAAGCNGGDLKPANPAGNPNIPQYTDDAVGDCSGGLTEVQDDIDNFRFFIEHLAPPAPAAVDPVTAVVGPVLFATTGCADCHSPLPFVTPPAPFNGVPGNFTFFPFSDFLVHDMGSLGDNIGNTGDSAAVTRQMRTPPLWGNRFNTQLLHDGRAHSVRDAILAHDGQGAGARNAFQSLSGLEQFILTTYVNAL